MKKILIIEDDPITKKIFIQYLKKEGYKVINADSGITGILQAGKNLPDLIFLDIMLKGKMDGIDVLRILKEKKKTKEIPVVILTNIGDKEKVCKDLGASDYLIKANTSMDEITTSIKLFIGDRSLNPY